MATVKSNQVTVNVVSPTSNTGSYCTQGMYITIYGSSTTPGTGKSYQYNYQWGPPSGYKATITPNFCIYYEGGASPTGCYCNFSTNSSNNVYGKFYTNGKGGWWAFLIILSTNYQFSIGWQE